MKKYMTKIKRDLLDRLTHLPTTTLGFIIILLGLVLVVFKVITMEQWKAFVAVAMPLFFYKREKNIKEENNEE
jgi:hypothetical protein